MRKMCGVQLKGRKRAKDLMMGLNETIDQLAMVNSANRHGHIQGVRMVMARKGH